MKIFKNYSIYMPVAIVLKNGYA